MAMNPDLYEQWKNEHSSDFERIEKQKAEQEQFEEAKKAFYQSTDIDNDIRDEKRKQALEETSVFSLKKQFVTDASAATKPVHHFNDNIDFQTSNAFYHSVTKNSAQNQLDNPMESQVLNELDPEVFEVAAKKENPIWKTTTYKDPSFRKELNKRTDPGFDTEMADKLHVNKFNKRITVISEYSNALHNGRVFKNPRFTSC